MNDIDAHIKTKYGLAEDDYWYHKPSGSWIMKHDAVVRIAAMEKISFDMAVIDVGSTKAVIVTASNASGKVQAIGECTPASEPSGVGKTYPWCLAQKRGEDRAVLRLLFPGGGMYSESEADDFRRDGAPDRSPGQDAPAPARKAAAPTAGDDAIDLIEGPEKFDARSLERQIAFGKHKGKTWNELASTDEGVNYLKWLVSQAMAESTNVATWKDAPVTALMAYRRRKAASEQVPDWMR